MRSIFVLLMVVTSAITAEENFVLIDGTTTQSVVELGSTTDERISPCSTFKIVLSLIGYDTGVLIDEVTPVWDFKEGYEDWLPTWRAAQTPQSWMQYSCVWYSRVLSWEVGLEKIARYLKAMEYGNNDVSGGLNQGALAWINSSLAISAKEQVNFLQRMVLGQLPISSEALQMTRAILFKEELPGGWKLYGKTGWSGSDVTLEHGWFVGWVERGDQFFPFAYCIREKSVDLGQRIPRTKELLHQAGLF